MARSRLPEAAAGGRRLATVARNLRVDAVTAEVIGALRAEGVRAVLLKGPAVAGWLYSDPGDRPYDDTDLLVAPTDRAAAERVLAGLGFAEFVGDEEVPAMAWLRCDDRATVDLHRRIEGVGAEPAAAWRELTARTGVLRVGGLVVDVLVPPGRAFHLALHAAQHGRGVDKPLADLARGLAALHPAVWRRAAELADRLDAVSAFAAGLRLTAAGAALAAELGLPMGRPASLALRADSAPRGALALERLAGASGFRTRAVAVARMLAPPPAHMRAFVPLARAGVPGLAAAYAWRAGCLGARLPGALRAWSRARREEAQ